MTFGFAMRAWVLLTSLTSLSGRGMGAHAVQACEHVNQVTLLPLVFPAFPSPTNLSFSFTHGRLGSHCLLKALNSGGVREFAD